MSSTGVCSHCGCTDIDSDPARGDAVCTNCGSVLEDQIIVSEIQFEDNAGGGSSVIGQFVSSDGSKPHSLGINFPHGIKRESRTVTYENGRRSIQQVGSQLRLNQHCIDTAFNFFKMAVNKRLTRGRKTTHVIAACLYLVCRTEGTPHMLLDFSDILQVNVYSLGRTYLQLSKELCISIPAIDPCLYIPRFAHKLELGDKTHEVSMTAMRLVQRMKRDWMHTGRRPSGLCGAALLVASRMHEFSRSVRQIIKVAKVCDTTIRKRLSEFKATPSSQLTIEEFQTVDLEEEQDPPAFTASKRKAQEAKFHAQLDKFPELESEVELIKEQIEKSMVPPKPVGIYAAYAKMSSSPDPLGDNEEVSRVSNFLEEETFKEAISDIDNDSETTTNHSVSYSTLRPTAASLGIKEVLSECLKESDSERDDGELDLHGIDDEELDKFLLSDDEIKLKTSIWMAENADYLKALEEKELRLAKEKEEEEKNPDKKKHRKRKKKPPSMGPAASAEEAIVRLLHEKKISNKINYEVLNDLKFTGVNRSPSKETTSSATVISNGEPVLNRFSKPTSRLRPDNSGKSSQNLSSKKLKLDETSEKETSKDLEVIVESGPVDFGPDDKEDEDEDDLVDEDEGCLSAAQLLGHSTDIDEVPTEIKLMTDKRSVELYLKLLESGSEKKRDIRLVVVGKKGAGKTSLIKRLFGEDNTDVTSTNGIEIHKIKCKAMSDDGIWNKLDGNYEETETHARLLKEYKEKLQDKGTTEEPVESHIAIKDNTPATNFDESKISGAVYQQPKIMTPLVTTESQVEPPLTTESQVEPQVMSQQQNQSIEQAKTDIEAMLKSSVDFQDKEEYATFFLWDFAGDEEFYHTHQTFLSQDAMYLVVTKLNEADDPNAQG